MADSWNKVSVDFKSMKWSEPTSIRNYVLLLDLIKFFVTHCDTSHTRVSFKLHTVSKNDIDAFNEEHEAFDMQIDHTMKSLLDILCILGSTKKMNDDQKEEVNGVIAAKAGLPEALEKFWRTDHTKANPLGLYGILCEYISLIYRIVKFLYYLTAEAVNLVSEYQNLSEIVSSLNLTANQVFLAEIARSQGLEKAQSVNNLLTQLMNRVELYFKIATKHNIDLSKPQGLKQNLDLFLPPVTIADPGSLLVMSEHYRQGTLMSYVILTRPVSITGWAEVKTMTAAIQGFFEKIQTVKADPLAKSIKQLPGIKEEVTHLMTRVITMTSDDTAPCSDEVTALMAEVDDVIIQLSKLFSEGIEIDSKTVGIDGKHVCFTWKKLLLIKRSQMVKAEKKADEAATKVNERAEKLVKSDVLPMCSRSNWGSFLIQWKKIESNFLNDESRFLALRAKLSDKSDIANTKNMSYSELYGYLCSRYGSFQAVFAEDLDTLQETKPCHSHIQLESFLVKLLTYVNLSSEPSNCQLAVYWTHSRVTKLFNTTLCDQDLRQFWAQYQSFKDDCLKNITSSDEVKDDTIPYLWERDFCEDRLEFLKGYINSSLQLIRNMRSLTKTSLSSSPSTSSGSSSTPRRTGNVVSKYEKWRCIICQSNHQSEKKNIRPYMSACKSFIDKSVEARIAFIRKYKYCMVCLGDTKVVRNHSSEGRCPNFKYNACSSCRQGPQHHPLLCMSRSRSSNHGSPRRGGGRGPPHGGPPPGPRPPGPPHAGRGRGRGRQPRGDGGGAPPACITGSHGIPLTQWSSSVSVNKISPSWLMKNRHTFQSVMEITLINKGAEYKHLSLSDSGSTGSFLVSEFAKYADLSPHGRWSGNLTTLMGSLPYSCNFYKLVLKVVRQDSQNSLPEKVVSWALETPRIGSRAELPGNIVLYLCQHYKCDPSEICSRAGNFGSLLGLDTQRFLLKEITHINQKKLVNPNHLQNISIQWTPLSEKLSLVGCMGGQSSDNRPDPNGRTFGVLGVVGQFQFYETPSYSDRESIVSQYQFSSVCKSEPALPQPKLNPDNPSLLTPTKVPVEPPKNGTAIKALHTSPQSAPPRHTKGRRGKSGFSWPNYSLLFTLISLGLAIAPPKEDIPHNQVAAFLHSPRRGVGHDVLRKPSCCSNPFPSLGKLLIRNPKSIALWLEVLQADIDPLAGDDVDSLGLQVLVPCDSCKKQIMSCPHCRSANSPLSEINRDENKLILDNISVIKDSKGNDRILFKYPFRCKFDEAFSPEKSNYTGALATTKILFKKLHSKALAQAFNDEIEKGVNDGHLRILSLPETNDILKQSHCFSFLNYTQKLSSSGHKIRPVSNSSANHQSGSANSWLPKGSSNLCDIVNIFESFRLQPFCLVSDIKRCYRSILSCDQSNRARLHMYPTMPLDPHCKVYTVMAYMCCTYGDSPIATCLELVMQYFVAPRVKDDLARRMLLTKRYVDDLLFSHGSKQELVRAMHAVEVSLNSLGFELKAVLSNSNFHHSIPNLETYSKAWEPQDTSNSEKALEVIFGHIWNFSDDSLRPNFKLFTGRKARGSFSGSILQETDLSKVKVTKRLVSSLTAQVYELDGCWSSILKTHLKILFSRCCLVTQSWSEDLTSTQVGEEVIKFLQVLKDKLHLIPSMPRCIVPQGYRVTQLNTFSDGSLTSCSYTIYLGMTAGTNRKSQLARACSKQKCHSIPCMEAAALWLSIEATVKYFLGHMDVFSTVKKIVFTIDSECILHSLNPQSPSSSILIKNVSTRVHTTCKELTKLHQVEVLFAHVDSLSNPSDLNSKWCASSDPISLSLEPIWQFGPPELCTPTYPPASKTFMMVSQGEITWLWSSRAPPSANLASYSCIHPDCMRVQIEQLIKVGSSVSTPLPTSIVGAHTGLAPEGILTWIKLLQHIPLLSDRFYNMILSDFHLERMISSVCKILQVYLPGQIKDSLRWQNSWVTYSLHYPSKPSPLMTQISFLTMLKKSWDIFGFSEIRAGQGQVVEGIVFATLRLTQNTIHKIFASHLVPVMPKKDYKLFFRLFSHCHVAPMGADGQEAHLPGFLTLSSMRSGPLACLSARQGERVQSLMKACTSCTRRRGGEPYTHTLGPPMLAAFVNVVDPLFASISIDIFSNFQCSQFKGARGKTSTFTVSVLIAQCMATRNISFVLLEDSKAASIRKALTNLFIRHRTPALILSDKDSAFTALLCNSSFSRDLGIKIVIAEGRHQFANYVEGAIYSCKEILKSLKRDFDKSIFAQTPTVIDLARQLELTSYIMGFSPILKGDFPETNPLTARHFSRLYISPQQDMVDVQRIVDSILCDSLEAIVTIRKNMNSCFQSALISHLTSSSIRYNPERLGDTSRTSSDRHVLHPTVEDIVLSKAHDGALRIGRIMELGVGTNQHMVRIKWHNSATDMPIHTRKLRLLFRGTQIDSEGFPLVGKAGDQDDVVHPATHAHHGLPPHVPRAPRPEESHDLQQDIREVVLPIDDQLALHVGHTLHVPIDGTLLVTPLGPHPLGGHVGPQVLQYQPVEDSQAQHLKFSQRK